MSSSDWPVTVDPIFGCWAYAGRLDANGRAPVYREIYEAEVGPIPDGLVLDHLCRRPACCRPSHLEPVTKSENERRKVWRRTVARARCPKGHDFKLSAIVVPPRGGRVCRECNRGPT